LGVRRSKKCCEENRRNTDHHKGGKHPGDENPERYRACDRKVTRPDVPDRAGYGKIAVK